MAERYAVPPDVGWVRTDGDEARVALAVLPDGPPAALHGASALIWLAAADGLDADGVVGRVAEETGEDATTVRDGVEHFLAELVDRGLLTRGQASSSRPSK